MNWQHWMKVTKSKLFTLFFCISLLTACNRDHELPSGRAVTATVLLERGFARQVSSRQYEINDQVAQDPNLRDAHEANPAVYYPRTKAYLIAGPLPGSDAYLRRGIAWGNNTLNFLIPANEEVFFAVDLRGGRVATAHVGAAILPGQGLGQMHVRLTSEHRDSLFQGDFEEITENHNDPKPNQQSDAVDAATDAGMKQTTPKSPASAE